MEYIHRVEPFEHQAHIFEETRDDEYHGLLWEQGTAKTKPVIDTSSWLYLTGKIDALLIVAPAGVHYNWITDELPAHLPEQMRGQVQWLAYEGPSKLKTKKYLRYFEELLEYNKFSIFVVTYDAFRTERAKELIVKFLKKRRCLFAGDESHHFKTPSAQRTRGIINMSKFAPYRRILTGTPITQSPFDLYSQMRFLHKSIWHPQGIKNFQAFKNTYGIFKTEYNHKTKQDYDVLIQYKGLSKLKKYIQPFTSRYLKEDVLDLPPKLYQKREVELTKEQRRMYTDLAEEFTTTWDDSGEEVNTELAITRLLRFQQITCGYLPCDDEKGANLKQIPGRNPKLETIEDLDHQITTQYIIWARFTRDVDLIMKLLGNKAVRYDGTISEDQALINKQAFQAGDAQVLVGNPAKGSEGLTLHMAKYMIYYNNSFKLKDRLQSEDRAHRAGMDDNPLTIIDLIAHDTVDEKIVSSLKNKLDVATQVTGDEIKEWI